MTAKTPKRISLRVYPVGFGDCFLLGFHYTAKDNRYVLIDFGSTELTKKGGSSRTPQSNAFWPYMKLIADDVAARCKTDGKDKRLHAVVATHRHADHINGFTTKETKTEPDVSGDVIASLKPRFVVQPWTEDPKLASDALGPPDSAPGGDHGFAALLAGMQHTAEGIVSEISRLDPRSVELPTAAYPDAADPNGASVSNAKSRSGARVAYVSTVRFLAADAVKNLSAVENLAAMGKAGKALFLHADAPLDLSLPGVKTHVLGPPTLKQSDAIRKMREKDDVEFWMLLGATGMRFAAGSGQPFSNRDCVPGARVPDHARWLRDRARAARAEVLHGIVRILDDQMNNTSLILVFEVGGAKLLFPGDAQIENWEYALGQEKNRKLLADTTLYKVGHHGSRNATPKEKLWAHFKRRSSDENDKDRLFSVMSTMAGKHGTTEATRVPRATLVDALKHDCNHHSTQDFKRKEVDFRDFEIDPATGRVTEIAKT